MVDLSHSIPPLPPPRPPPFRTEIPIPASPLNVLPPDTSPSLNFSLKIVEKLNEEFSSMASTNQTIHQ